MIAVFLLACASPPPADLGAPGGRLRPCPSSPNCVSSLDTDETHRIDPLPWAAGNSLDQVAAVIATMPRAKVVRQEQNYLHAEFTSATWRFVDDVELVVGDGALQVRSASRVGYGDLGANRARVEALRALWAPISPAP